MNIVMRLWRVIRSNLNALIGRAEEPAKMIEQALLDMHGNLEKTTQRVAAVIADEKKLRQEFEREQRASHEWERRALHALDEGREDLAKQALLRHGEHLRNAKQLSIVCTEHKAETVALKQALRGLRDRVGELKRTKSVLLARKTRVDAQREIQHTMSTIRSETAVDSFRRMEDKIADMERQTSAAAELANELDASDLEREFERLEKASEADARLIELKQKVELLAEAEPTPPLLADDGQRRG